MSQVKDIISEYAQMRDSGMDSKSALYTLRHRIEVLSRTERDDLAALLRVQETKSAAPPPEISTSVPAIKPLKSSNVIRPIAPPIPQTDTAEMRPVQGKDNIVWVTCPNCGKANQKHEVFCYACGGMLETARGTYETRHFADADTQLDSEYFSPESILVLRPRGSSDVFEARPQKATHEIVIGRVTTGSAMMPDIDLNSKNAENLGVSRLHLSVRYDPQNNAVLVSDLGSANGTFINGQKVMAKEVRVLRHGDELRLGKLILTVSFRHPGQAN